MYPLNPKNATQPRSWYLFLLFFTVLFIVWCFAPAKNKTAMLIKAYKEKDSYRGFSKRKVVNRVVLVIEVFDSLENLLFLLENILRQSLKIDLIVLVSDEAISVSGASRDDKFAVELINSTCVIQKVGGLAMLLKESDDNSVLVFVRTEGFVYFKKPEFLQNFLNNTKTFRGVTKVYNSEVLFNLNNVYSSTQ